MSTRRFYRDRYYRRLDIYRLAGDLKRMGIDIAPTRMTWQRVAREIADSDGESGRKAFHLIASVWPDYSERDSDRCYDWALKQADGLHRRMRYIIKACSRNGLQVLTARYWRGAPVKYTFPKKKIFNRKAMAVNYNYFIGTQVQDSSLIGRNQLTDLLLRLFPQGRVRKVLSDYCVGLDSYVTGRMGDALIFWQINQDLEVINGKAISYNADGHRNKKVPPLVLYPANGQCLFGLHLLQGDKENNRPIGIVESEKTAIIMAIVEPALLWMATGSLDNFGDRMLKPIRARRIIAYPDLDIKAAQGTNRSYTYVQWRNEAMRMNSRGFNISVSDLLERMANTYHKVSKWDISDFVLEGRIKSISEP